MAHLVQLARKKYPRLDDDFQSLCPGQIHADCRLEDRNQPDSQLARSDSAGGHLEARGTSDDRQKRKIAQ